MVQAFHFYSIDTDRWYVFYILILYPIRTFKHVVIYRFSLDSSRISLKLLLRLLMNLSGVHQSYTVVDHFDQYLVKPSHNRTNAVQTSSIFQDRRTLRHDNQLYQVRSSIILHSCIPVYLSTRIGQKITLRL